MLFKEEKKSDTDILIEMLLERGDRKSTRLAKLMFKNDSKHVFGMVWTKSGLKERSLAKKYLYSLFDDETRRKMIALDSIVSETDSKIPWSLSYYRDEYTHRDHFTNWDDPEVRDCDTYSVVRREDGFEPADVGCNDGYGESIYSVEKGFVKKYKKELGEMHFALTKQEELLRNCGLKSEDDRELAMLLSYRIGYLDYYKEKRAKEKNKELIK